MAMDGSGTYLKEANDLLKTLSPKDISSYVASLMANDPALVHSFLQRFGPFDFERAKTDLLMNLRNAEYEFSEYDGFVHWRRAGDYASAIRQIAKAHLGNALAHEKYKSALSLGFEAYLFITKVDTDDEGNFFDDLVDILDDSWDAVLNAARARNDDALIRQLFDMLVEYISSPDIRRTAHYEMPDDYAYNAQCEHIEDYLVRRFCDMPAYAPTLQRLADIKMASAIKLSKERAAADKRMGMPIRGQNPYMQDVARWVLVRVRCMETVGATYDERIKFANDYLCVRDVCLYFVDASERTDNRAEALRLVEACLDDAREKGMPAPDWALERAISLYEHAGDSVAVRRALEQLVVSGAFRKGSTKWLRKLRELCVADEWPMVRDRLFSAVEIDSYRWRYYVQEKLFDRLMDEIEQVGVPALSGYEELLAPRYPERVLAMYRKGLLGPGGRKPPIGSTRNAYARYASQVKHVRSIPGGDELADHIVARVLELYPRRPALRDELSEA